MLGRFPKKEGARKEGFRGKIKVGVLERLGVGIIPWARKEPLGLRRKEQP